MAFQYSLRRLFLCVTIVSLGLGFVGWRIHLARERDRAFALAKELIEECGGKFAIEQTGENYYIHLADTSVTDDHFQSMARCFRKFSPKNKDGRGNFSIYLNNTAITDRSISELAGLKIVILDLSGTKVSDASIPHLGQLPLTRLSLAYTSVTSQGADELMGVGLLNGCYVDYRALVHDRHVQFAGHKKKVAEPAQPPAENNPLDILDVPLLTLKYSWGSVDAAFSADGKLLATATSRDGLRLTDLQTGEVVRVRSELNSVRSSPLFAPHGKLVLGRGIGSGFSGGARAGALLVLGLPTLVELHALRVTPWKSGMAVSPDSKRVVACAAEGPVCVWDLATGEKMQTLDVNGQKIIDIRYSPDGTMLAMLDSEGRCEVYEAKTGARLAMAERLGDEREELRFSPNGEQLAIGTRDGVYFWDYDTGHPRQVRIPQSLRAKPHLGINFGGGITRISPDLRTATTQMEFGDIGIWDIASRKVLAILPAGHQRDTYGGGVESILFSADGDLLATSNRTGLVEVWRLRGTRQPVPGAQPIDAEGEPGPWGPIVNGIRTRLIMEPVKPDAQANAERHVDGSRMPVSEGVWWRAKLQVQNTTDHAVGFVWPEVRREEGFLVTTEDGTPIPYQSFAGDSEVTRKIPMTITRPGDIHGIASLLIGRNHDLSRPGKYRIQFPRTETQPPLPIDTTNPILPESNVLEFKNSGPLKEEGQE